MTSMTINPKDLDDDDDVIDDEEGVDSDEGDAEDDGDADEGDVEAAPAAPRRPPPPPRRPPRPRAAPPPPPREPPMQREIPPENPNVLLRKEQWRDFEDFVQKIDMKKGGFELHLYRTEPKIDPDTGIQIAGPLTKYDRPISEFDIKQQFGGGVYQIVIRGPREDGKGNVVRHRLDNIAIPGKPIVPEGISRRRENEDKAVSNLVEKAFTMQVEAAQQAREEMREQSAMLLKVLTEKKEDPAIATFTTALLEMKRDQQEREAREEARRREEREERRREEEKEREERRRADEKEREEARRREEREERRRAEEKEREEARRREEREREEERRRDEREREERRWKIEMEEKRRADQIAQQLRELDNQRFELMMKAKENEQKIMLEMMKSQAETERRAFESQLALLREDLKRKDTSIMAEIEKFRMLQEIINPPEEEKHPLEKVADKVMPFASALVGRMGMTAAPAPVANPSPPQLAPGSVVVSETDEWEEYDEDEEPGAGAAQVLPPTRIREFPDPPTYSSTDPTVYFTDVVRRLDLCVARETSVEEAYQRVIVPLPPEGRALLAASSIEQILEGIAGAVGEDWPIRSAAGEVLLKRLHRMLVEKLTSGEA